MPDVTKEKLTAEEIRRQKKLSEQMGNIEFQMDMAPYTNYTSSPDPEKVTYRGVPSGVPELTLSGFVGQGTGKEMRRGRVRGQDISIMDSPEGSPTAVGASATGPTWTHEQRHVDNPEMSEAKNRLMDGAVALNEQDWKEAVRFWRDEHRRNGRKLTLAEAEAQLLESLQSDANYNKRGVQGEHFGKEFAAGGTNPPTDMDWSGSGILKKMFLDDEGTYVDDRINRAYWKQKQMQQE